MKTTKRKKNHRTLTAYLRADENIFLMDKLKREVTAKDLSGALLEKHNYYELN